ncbi:Holliday junction DNA helicase subunit RuvA, partial [human gut metagenome]
MYEYLSGTISELAPTHAVLDVGGVGYFLQISLQTYSEIEHSDRVKLFVHY